MVCRRISVLLGLALVVVCATGDSSPWGSDPVRVKRQAERRFNLILTLHNPIEPVLQRLKNRTFASHGARVAAVRAALRNATNTWHAPVLEALRPHNGVTAETFWISNQIAVRNATEVVLFLLRGLSIIKTITEEIIIPLIPILNPAIGSAAAGPEWGVQNIGAVEVWNQTRGEGIRVAIIDTGVRGSHVALRDNYVGNEEHGWFDPIWRLPIPTDFNGHGTHCTGIVCGNNGIGVAPAAKWMACRGCDNAGCPQSALLACGQWVVCPTDVWGFNADCTKAPHIVSNSWVFPGNTTFFNEVITAWEAAGIIGFFAIGNEGPSCSTAKSPGDQPGIISVGSTNINNTVSSFSSRGPKVAPDGFVTPLIVAPGENINSAYHVSDTSYQVMSGTSMATPNAAGAAALLLSRDPDMEMEDLQALLFSTANKNLGATGSQCGDNAENVYPNEIAGNGRIDVQRAYAMMTSP